MSKHILTADGHLYHYEPAGDELYHYGVKGMKWGVRKQLDLVSKRQMKRNARTARLQAKRDAISKGYGEGVGAHFNIRKVGNRAYRRSIAADQAHNATELAKGWNQMADRAEAKGKIKKASKYLNLAMSEKSKAAKLEMMSKLEDKAVKAAAKHGKAVISKSIEVLKATGNVAKATANKGKRAVDRYIEKNT